MVIVSVITVGEAVSCGRFYTQAKNMSSRLETPWCKCARKNSVCVCVRVCTNRYHNVLAQWSFYFLKKDKLPVPALKLTFVFAGQAVPNVSRWQYEVILSTSFLHTRWIFSSRSRCPPNHHFSDLMKRSVYKSCLSLLYILFLTFSPFYFF